MQLMASGAYVSLCLRLQESNFYINIYLCNPTNFDLGDSCIKTKVIEIGICGDINLCLPQTFVFTNT